MIAPTLLGFGPDPPAATELAEQAIERGRSALAAGDSGEATRWLDRALRLLPRDPTIKLLLAAACTQSDPSRAAGLFQELAAHQHVPEVRTGLARFGGERLSPVPSYPGPLEGLVLADGDSISGWAWHPYAPEHDPTLTVIPETGAAFTITAAEPAPPLPGTLLSRPRKFEISARQLRRRVRVTGPDGQDLPGSPIDLGAEARRCRLGSGAVPPRRIPRWRAADVIVAVHGGGAMVIDCLQNVLHELPRTARLIIVDDATPDPALRAYLDTCTRDRRVRLIRHRKLRGFPAAANAGLRACAPHDAILLNSDTLVPAGWIERLRAAAYSAPDIATATPLSNNASILSYPGQPEANLMPDAAETARLDRLAQRANGGRTVDIPVGVGFCMYIRRDCLDAVGRFRTDLFAQGYGEENDLCLRASRLGWRHVAVPGLFVAHRGGMSFGPAGRALQARNEAILNRIHPGYRDRIAAWVARDPLAGARRRLDRMRFHNGNGRRPSVLLITHRDGGGVERCIGQASAAIEKAGRRAIVLRPNSDARDTVAISDGPDREFLNLRYRLPGESEALLRFFRTEHVTQVELHHLLGHPEAVPDLIAALDVPCVAHVHDHSWFCPRVVLIDRDSRYCGEPDLRHCETCVATAGSAFENVGSVAGFRARSGRILRNAKAVRAPSADAASRLARHFPGLRPEIVPHETEAPEAASPQRPFAHRICIVGAIGVQKGYRVLLDCAQDAAARALPLHFVVAGTTIDDRPLLATGRVFITGSFAPHEATALIRAQRARLAWLPSIWPETWCFALSDVWRSGLEVAAFDIGAQAERIRRTGRGILLPLGLCAARINNVLLAASAA